MAIRTVTIEVKMDISNAEAKIATLTVSMKGLGDEVKRTGKSTDDFERLVTKNMREGETAFQALTRRSKELRGEIDGLKGSFGGSSNPNKSILGDLSKAKNDLKGIEHFLSDMHSEGAQAGKSWSDSFILSFRSIPEFLASPIGGTLTAVLAPALIAGVAAAVTAGVGLGIIGAGAYIVHNDPRIQAVFAPLAADVESVFKDSAGSLVTPIIDALGGIDAWVQQEKPAFAGLFASVAPAIGTVGQDFEILIGDLVPALTRVGKTFTSVLNSTEVQNSLKGVSAAFSDIFNAIGNNPKEVADGILFLNGVLKGTFGLLKDIFLVVGPVVAALRQLRTVNSDIATGGYDPGLQPGQGTPGNPLTPKQIKAAGGDPSKEAAGQYLRVSNAAVEAAKAQGNYADNAKQAAAMTAAAAEAAKNAVPDFKTLSSTLGATTATADTLAGQLTDKVLTGMLAVDNANNNFNKSLVTVGDTIVALGGNLTQHVKALKKTETGQQQETDAVLAAIQANLQVYDSQIAVGVSADDAAAAYDKNAKALDAQVRSAGHVPPAVQKLIDKYAKVPKNVNTVIAMQGLTSAINNLDTTLRLINHLDGFTANAYVTTHYKTIGRPPGQAAPKRWGDVIEGGYQHADIGLTSAGIYSPPTRYAFAEPATGGEAFIPRLGDYSRSMGIIQAAAGWYNATVVPNNSMGRGGGINVTISFAPGAPSALRDLIRVAVKETGQGVVGALSPR